MMETIQCSIILQGVAVCDTGTWITDSYFHIFYKQGIPEHESNEMVVCHADMTDIANDETAQHSSAASFRNLAGTLSGPLALLGFCFYCLITPSMSKFISGISGNSFLQD